MSRSRPGSVPSSMSDWASEKPLSTKVRYEAFKTPYGFYPPGKGQQFARPGYKFFSTFDEELSFRQKHNLPANAPIIPNEFGPPKRQLTRPSTTGSVRSRRTMGQGSTPPLLRQIQRLEEQKRKGPSVWHVENSRVGRPKFGKAPTMYTQPEPGWKPGYPEPDLRRAFSPVFTESPTSTPPRTRPVTASAQTPHPPSTQRNQTAIVKRPRPGTAPPSALMAEQIGLAQTKEAAPDLDLEMESGTSPAGTPEDEVAPQLPVEEAVVAEEAAEEAVEEAPAQIDTVRSEDADILEDKYDKALNKHGWMMQIPGDPLNLKTKYLPQRLAYTVKVPVPKVTTQPPKMHRTNKTTFFQVTIPKQPLSFDIHPDFMSEKYNVARDKMKKQGLWNYADKNFAFIY